MPVHQGESIHEALQILADERLEVGFSELATQYLFFAPMAGLERTKPFDKQSADLKALAKMGLEPPERGQ